MIKKVFHGIRAVKNFIKERPYIEGMSFSQNTEDLIFLRLLSDFNVPLDNGFYVDVGAHDPIRFSNTYNLYKRGWRGINIDPLPSCVERFARLRPRDINLNIGIADKVGEMEYFDFDEPAMNTFNPSYAQHTIEKGVYKLKQKRSIKIDTLRNVFSTYVTEGGVLTF